MIRMQRRLFDTPISHPPGPPPWPIWSAYGRWLLNDGQECSRHLQSGQGGYMSCKTAVTLSRRTDGQLSGQTTIFVVIEQCASELSVYELRVQSSSAAIVRSLPAIALEPCSPPSSPASSRQLRAVAAPRERFLRHLGERMRLSPAPMPPPPIN